MRVELNIKKLQDKQIIEIEKVLFFCQDEHRFQDVLKEIEKDFKPLNVKVERITLWDFDEKLDYYFSNSDYLFYLMCN